MTRGSGPRPRMQAACPVGAHPLLSVGGCAFARQSARRACRAVYSPQPARRHLRHSCSSSRGALSSSSTRVPAPALTARIHERTIPVGRCGRPFMLVPQILKDGGARLVLLPAAQPLLTHGELRRHRRPLLGIVLLCRDDLRLQRECTIDPTSDLWQAIAARRAPRCRRAGSRGGVMRD